jgi:hypothetical protein
VNTLHTNPGAGSATRPSEGHVLLDAVRRAHGLVGDSRDVLSPVQLSALRARCAGTTLTVNEAARPVLTLALGPLVAEMLIRSRSGLTLEVTP